MSANTPFERIQASSIPLSPRLRSQGSSLILMMALIALIVVIVGISFRLTQNVGRNANRGTDLAIAQMAAEGCLEYQFSQWRSLCKNASQFAPPTTYFSTISMPTTDMLPSLSATTNFATSSANTSYSISNYKITAVDAYMNPINGQPQGLSIDWRKNQIWQYLATVDVTVPGVKGPQTIGLSRIFQLVNRSPWTYAIFYDGNLEINPGAAMTVSGDVFTNSKLYTNLGGGMLTFNNSVTAVNGVSLTGANYSFTQGSPTTGVASQDPMGVDSIALSTADNATNQNNDSYHEIIEAPVGTGADPFTPTTVDPAHPPQRFYNAADLKITITNNTADTQTPSFTIVDVNNKAVASSISTALRSGATVNSVTIPKVLTLGSQTASVGGYTVGTSIQDSRESAKVRLVNVDVGALKSLVDNAVIKTGTGGTANIPNQFNKGGMLVYIHQSDTVAAGTLQGVRLINGNNLPTGGLTVVSDNPVYIMGDYNNGTTWQPSAVIGDAVTILSNKWVQKDTTWAGNTSIASGGRVATATTVNTAIMSGNVITPDSGLGYNDTGHAYSGGVENFPRFQESWTGVNFNYLGSMVSLYASKQASHVWPGTGTVYNPPNRNWSFDQRFINQPPPGSFTVTSYNKQRWLRR